MNSHQSLASVNATFEERSHDRMLLVYVALRVLGGGHCWCTNKRQHSKRYMEEHRGGHTEGLVFAKRYKCRQWALG